mmetsp:Transcript_40260/g.46074  ORF Transcript_40260/g.46074 Transcript_40260/m.46074 type:complete len:162 (+) Transcript_40260:357-842(+)
MGHHNAFCFSNVFKNKPKSFSDLVVLLFLVFFAFFLVFLIGSLVISTGLVFVLGLFILSLSVDVLSDLLKSVLDSIDLIGNGLSVLTLSQFSKGVDLVLDFVIDVLRDLILMFFQSLIGVIDGVVSVVLSFDGLLSLLIGFLHLFSLVNHVLNLGVTETTR